MAGNVFFFDWEIPLMQWLQSFECDLTTALATFFTMLGEDKLLVVVLGICFWCVDKELGRRVSLAMMGGMICGSLIKGVVLRRRPYMDNPEVKCIRASDPDGALMNPVEQGFSFPSLHAVMSAAAYGTIASYTRKKWTLILAIAMPFFIGLSRNYLGVHYPTDVMFGWALGIAMLLIFGVVCNKYGYRKGFLLVLLVGAIGFIYSRDNEFFSAYGITLGLLLGFAFEEKHVNFPMPTKWWSFIVRPLIGVLVFIAMSELLKIPVSGMVATQDNLFLLFYRLARYTISVFVMVGVYPISFKIGKKQKNAS